MLKLTLGFALFFLVEIIGYCFGCYDTRKEMQSCNTDIRKKKEDKRRWDFTDEECGGRKVSNKQSRIHKIVF